MSKNTVIGLIVALVAAAIVVAAVVLFVVVLPAQNQPTPTPAATTTTRSTTTGTPRTTASPTGSAPPSATSTPTPALKSVTPFITSDGYDASTKTLSLYANVPGVIDDQGTCTATVSGPGPTVTGRFDAHSTGSAMDCGAMTLQSATFTSGTWTVEIDYSSTTAKGAATGYQVYIP